MTVLASYRHFKTKNTCSWDKTSCMGPIVRSYNKQFMLLLYCKRCCLRTYFITLQQYCVHHGFCWCLSRICWVTVPLPSIVFYSQLLCSIFLFHVSHVFLVKIMNMFCFHSSLCCLTFFFYIYYLFLYNFSFVCLFLFFIYFLFISWFLRIPLV